MEVPPRSGISEPTRNVPQYLGSKGDPSSIRGPERLRLVGPFRPFPVTEPTPGNTARSRPRGLDANTLRLRSPSETHPARGRWAATRTADPRRLGVKRPSRRVREPLCYLVLLLCNSANLGSGVSGGRCGLTTSLNQASC